MRSNSPNNFANKDGFTLIEVLISIVILAFISLGLYNAIIETYRIRDTLSTEGDFHNGIRLSMNVLQRDITLLYSPVGLLPTPSASPSGVPQASQPAQVPNPAAQGLPGDADLTQTTDFWEPTTNKNGVRPSRFTGTENKLTFVSNSHFRVYRDSAESEFADITYELDRDDADPTLQMLVKIENIDAFNVDPRTRAVNDRRFTLLHGIKAFKYRYYRKDKDEWAVNWDTDKDEFKVNGQGVYPDIVEITLQVTNGKKLTFDGRFLFRPELPLRALNPNM
jgi:prepilin-type N-terminal cleavage/methylation domain-containing protein